MLFDGDQTEEVTLSDGTRVVLRAIRPEDKPLLQRGMARLSPQSRYRRFMYSRGELTGAELAYLTEVDGIDYFAFGALLGDEGVAVARFIRVAPGSDTAEAAIAVVDEQQGKGLGRLLLERLVAAARERGVTRFRGEVLAGNAPMMAILREAAASVTDVPGEVGTVVADVALEGLPLEPPPTPLRRLFALVAQGLLRIRPHTGDG